MRQNAYVKTRTGMFPMQLREPAATLGRKQRGIPGMKTIPLNRRTFTTAAALAVASVAAPSLMEEC